MKKLSLTLPSAQSSSGSLPALSPSRQRRPSVISLPATTSLLHRKDEDGGSQSVPYADGPIQVIPGIWIGSEDNARDWKTLIERGIRSILNVAKEVASPFDSLHSLRPAVSTPDFRHRNHPDPTYYPAHVPSGRPAMHYLKLQWSHGQQDLVDDGFKAGMAFADAALARGQGCLIQYVYDYSLSSHPSHPPIYQFEAVNAASPDRPPWSLPLSCAQQPSVTPRSPPRFGPYQACKLLIPL